MAWLKSKELCFIAVNEAFGRACGLRPEQVIGKNDFDIWPKELAERYRLDDREVMESGKRKRTEESSVDAESKVKWTETIKTPIFDPIGQVTGVSVIARDITERKLMEVALTQAYSQLKSVINSASQVSIIATDTSGIILTFNSGAERMLGYSAEELVGKQTPAIIHFEPEVTARGKELTKELGYRVEGFEVFVVYAKQGKYDEREWTYIRKDGAHLIVNLAVTSVRNDAGQIVGFLGTAVDITERRKAEDALRDRERLLNQMGAIAKIGGWEIDLTAGGKATWTKGTYDIVEIEYDKPIPEFHEYYLPEYREMAREKMNVLIKTQQPMEFEAMLKTAKGNTKWCKVIGETVMENGKTVKLRGTFQDLTERKQAEDALRESEKRFMDVLYASQDAILLIDGNKFADCNEATARMLGYSSRNEFLMVHPSQLSPPTQPDGRSSFDKAEEMMKIASEKGFNRFEWMHRKASGEDFPVEVSLTPVAIHGKNVIHCVWRDITERKKAEDSVKKSIDDLRHFKNVTLDREERMIGLKKEINGLSKELGRPEPYEVPV